MVGPGDRVEVDGAGNLIAEISYGRRRLMAIDPVSLGILWDRLISITDEVLSTLVRTSFSSNVRDSYDLSVLLFSADGRSLVQGTIQRALLHRHRAGHAASHAGSASPPTRSGRAT